jgi:Raf kinase inhibitor-like YbhB/YbcL family protein
MRIPLLESLLLLALTSLSQAAPREFRLTSPDFAEGASIPARFTCQGQNTPPILIIAGTPPAALSLALVVEDPDAPSGTFTHWLIWNIPPGTKKLVAGALPAGAMEGTNDFGSTGYSGPCPPSGTHRYFFRLSAVDTALHLPAGASRHALDTALDGHVIAKTALMGRYAR